MTGVMISVIPFTGLPNTSDVRPSIPLVERSGGDALEGEQALHSIGHCQVQSRSAVATMDSCQQFSSPCKLKLGRLLGQGSFASVYKAMHNSQVVAVKVLRPEYATHRLVTGMLLKEANLLTSLSHPYIVRCRGLCQAPLYPQSPPLPAMVMDFLEGGSLAELILKQMRAPKYQLYSEMEALTWMLQVADALTYLHRHDPVIIHRDVKPANVLLSHNSGKCQGLGFGRSTGPCKPRLEARLCDFGLHQAVRAAQHRPMVRVSSHVAHASSSGIFHTPRVSEDGSMLLPNSILDACERIKYMPDNNSGVADTLGSGSHPTALACHPTGSQAGWASKLQSTLSSSMVAAAAVGPYGNPGAGPPTPQPACSRLARETSGGGVSAVAAASTALAAAAAVYNAQAQRNQQVLSTSSCAPPQVLPYSLALRQAAVMSASQLSDAVGAGGVGTVASTTALPSREDLPNLHMSMNITINNNSRCLSQLLHNPPPLPNPLSHAHQCIQHQHTLSHLHPSHDLSNLSAKAKSSNLLHPPAHPPQPHQQQQLIPQQHHQHPPPQLLTPPSVLASSAASGGGGGPLQSWIARHKSRKVARRMSCPRLSMEGLDGAPAVHINATTAAAATPLGNSLFPPPLAPGGANARPATTVATALPPLLYSQGPLDYRGVGRVLSGIAVESSMAASEGLPAAAPSPMPRGGRGGAAVRRGPSWSREAPSTTCGAGAGAAATVAAMGPQLSPRQLVAAGMPACAIGTDGGGGGAGMSVSESVEVALSPTCDPPPDEGGTSTGTTGVVRAMTAPRNTRAPAGPKQRLHSFAVGRASESSCGGGGGGGGGGGPSGTVPLESTCGSGFVDFPYLERVFALSGQCGSSIYMSPEVAQEHPYNEKTDVFSFAITCFEVLSRTLICKTAQGRDGHGFTRMLVEGRRPQLPSSLDPRVSALIRACWHADPLERPTMAQVVATLQSVLYGDSDGGSLLGVSASRTGRMLSSRSGIAAAAATTATVVNPSASVGAMGGRLLDPLFVTADGEGGGAAPASTMRTRTTYDNPLLSELSRPSHHSQLTCDTAASLSTSRTTPRGGGDGMFQWLHITNGAEQAPITAFNTTTTNIITTTTCHHNSGIVSISGNWGRAAATAVRTTAASVGNPTALAAATASAVASPPTPCPLVVDEPIPSDGSPPSGRSESSHPDEQQPGRVQLPLKLSPKPRPPQPPQPEAGAEAEGADESAARRETSPGTSQSQLITAAGKLGRVPTRMLEYVQPWVRSVSAAAQPLPTTASALRPARSSAESALKQIIRRPSGSSKRQGSATALTSGLASELRTADMVSSSIGSVCDEPSFGTTFNTLPLNQRRAGQGSVGTGTGAEHRLSVMVLAVTTVATAAEVSYDAGRTAQRPLLAFIVQPSSAGAPPAAATSDAKQRGLGEDGDLFGPLVTQEELRAPRACCIIS